MVVYCPGPQLRSLPASWTIDSPVFSVLKIVVRSVPLTSTPLLLPLPFFPLVPKPWKPIHLRSNLRAPSLASGQL